MNKINYFPDKIKTDRGYILNKNSKIFQTNTTISKENEKIQRNEYISKRREEKLKGRKEEMRVEVNRGKERLWADTVGNRSDRSIDQSI